MRAPGELAFDRKTSRSTLVTTAPGAIDFVTDGDDDDSLENVTSVTPRVSPEMVDAVLCRLERA